MDISDTFETIKICVAYRCEGQIVTTPPLENEQLSLCEPIYEILPGWQQSTQGIQHWEDLPKNAQAYLTRIETLLAVPIALISTGAGREETIRLKALF